MISLFKNQTPEKTNDQYDRVDSDYSDLFNAETDEILFFDFGMSREKFIYNNPLEYPSIEDKTGIFNYFIDNYFYLQSQYSAHGGDIDSFMNDCFSKCRSIVRGSVAPAYGVFPLILAKVPREMIAEEYYLIILSDYNDPTGFGQSEDIRRYREAIASPSFLILQETFINPMNSKVKESRVFRFGYVYYPSGNHGPNPDRSYAYIAGFKILPENITRPVVESNIKFEQLRYGEDTYNYDAIKIHFPHTDDLLTNSIYEDISFEKGGTLNREVEVVKERDFYTIPSSEVELPNFVRDKDSSSLEVKYTFHTQLKLLDSCFLNLVHITHPRSLSLSGIVLQSPPPPLVYWIRRLLPFAIFTVLALLGIAISRGRVKKFKINVHGYTEKLYRETKNCTTEEHDYYTSKDNKTEVKLSITITPVYKKFFRIRWGCSPNLKNTTIDGLKDIVLETRIHNELEKGDEFVDSKVASDFIPQKDVDGKFKYGITIKPTLNTKWDFENNKRYIFTLKTNFYVVKHKFLWFRFLGKKIVQCEGSEYTFEIGPKLFGNIWAGFDPGTTGSSIAFGRKQQDIYLSKIEYKVGNQKLFTEINSSVIAFTTEQIKQLSEQEFKNWSPKKHYLYGNDANHPYATNKFISSKKTLGYDFDCLIKMEGKILFELKGEQVFTLQIRGMYKDMEKYISEEGKGYKEGYMSQKEKAELFENEKEYIPRRVVAAVPNSFNNYRTQAMIDSINSYGKFDEIITVYEPEAVLFYCIKDSIVKANSKVLIFDMGGATINTSFFDYQYQKPNYIIDTLGRIGYGIGGDTIDFCIINAILAMPTVRNVLGIVDDKSANTYRDNHAEKLLSLAFKIKEYIVDIVLKSDDDTLPSPWLFTANSLRLWIYDLLEMEVDITEETGEFKKMFGDSGKYFFDTFIEPVVYKNIRDAIKELKAFDEVAACRDEPVSLVFSGRSTAFPFVKKNVKDALKKQGFTEVDEKRLDKNKSLDKLKTVVAEGACFYGISREYIKPVNNKAFYSFVLLKHKSLSNDSIEFKTFITRGEKLEKREIRDFKEIGNNKYEYGIAKDRKKAMGLCKTIAIKEDAQFINDGRSADIYQVTGNRPKEVFKEKLKFKYLLSLNAKGGIKELELEMQPNDSLFCIARYDVNSNNDEIKKANVESRDIADENDEHYTFALKINDNQLNNKKRGIR